MIGEGSRIFQMPNMEGCNPIFTQNCTKMKKFGFKWEMGVCLKFLHADPPLVKVHGKSQLE